MRHAAAQLALLAIASPAHVYTSGTAILPTNPLPWKLIRSQPSPAHPTATFSREPPEEKEEVVEEEKEEESRTSAYFLAAAAFSRARCAWARRRLAFLRSLAQPRKVGTPEGRSLRTGPFW